MRTFEHVTAVSAREAISSLGGGAGDARIVAGGTDLLPLMNADLVAPSRLIDLKPANELRYLRFADDGTLRIGALATLAEVERTRRCMRACRCSCRRRARRRRPNCATWRRWAAICCNAHAAGTIAAGTIAGCSGGAECFAREGENEHHAIFEQGPCVAVHPSDLAPALIALDATVELDGPRGARTLPVADFLAPPSEGRRIEHVLRQASWSQRSRCRPSQTGRAECT